MCHNFHPEYHQKCKHQHLLIAHEVFPTACATPSDKFSFLENRLMKKSTDIENLREDDWHVKSKCDKTRARCVTLFIYSYLSSLCSLVDSLLLFAVYIILRRYMYYYYSLRCKECLILRYFVRLFTRTEQVGTKCRAGFVRYKILHMHLGISACYITKTSLG